MYLINLMFANPDVLTDYLLDRYSLDNYVISYLSLNCFIECGVFYIM